MIDTLRLALLILSLVSLWLFTRVGRQERSDWLGDPELTGIAAAMTALGLRPAAGLVAAPALVAIAVPPSSRPGPHPRWVRARL